MHVNRRELYNALQQLNKVVDHRSSFSVLRCIKIEAGDGVAVLTGTDLTQTLTARIPAEGDLQACVLCKPLTDMVKPKNKNDDVDVRIEIEDDDTVRVCCDGVSTKLYTVDVQNFPLNDLQGWDLVGEVDSGLLSQALAYVLPVACKDKNRVLSTHGVCGVYFNAEGKLVATSGHQCHVADLHCEFSESFLIPTGPAQTLSRIIKRSEKTEFFKTSEKIMIRSGSWIIEAKLLEEEFPPYFQIIPNPEACKTRLEICPKSLIKAIKVIESISNIQENGLKMTINEALTLEGGKEEVGQTRVKIETTSNTHKGQDLIIGFNPKYILEAVTKKDAAAIFHFSGSLDPLRVDLDDRIAVIMPRRIG